MNSIFRIYIENILQENKTALMLASYKGHTPCVEALINAAADVQAKTSVSESFYIITL